MLKKWTIGITLLTTSMFSQASIIETSVTGAEMDGMNVAVCFDVDLDNNGQNDCYSDVWAADGADSGSASVNDWFSLSLAGNSFPDFDPVLNKQHGHWTLNNLNADYDIVSFSIDAIIAGVVFDAVYGDLNAGIIDVVTPGSGAGYPFMSTNGDAVANFSGQLDPAYNDLFGQLDVSFGQSSLAANGSMIFTVDTDLVAVSEPATLFTMALSLVALTRLRRNK